ncbi:class I SAM-dependent methyltransferase [Haloplanus rubicundus]|uniref:Methyltransferase domain-containing protein n=1 Tax=Haloplanus rubicundus TaxID=1547898 RepID=A0A345EAW3_9EURY|nr:methyltransferase domain-containing protein [Haloplanus rubicundus]AXG09335.1 methyltransferase domain-containing protein [Haloplanus rubicundus]
MKGLLDAALADPWRTLDTLLDGPLHPGGRAATERLLDRADVGTDTRLLEVGCGAGDALSLARDRGADAVGLDPDPASDAAASRTIRGGATALPVRDDAVDVVLAECVLCLTDLPAALAECRRVLRPGGRLAVSDVVIEGDGPAIPDRVAAALCLTGARSRGDLTAALDEAGFAVRATHDHHDELVAMRDRVQERVDYDALLGLLGERGERIRTAVEDVEAAVDDGRIGYVSVVARAE